MDNVLLSFTPALSKKLIAKGVSALPEVQKALTQGKILIGAGTTTAQIYLELGGELSEGAALACGMITSKGLCVGHGMTDFVGTHGHAKFWLLDRGQMVQSGDLDQALQALSSGDVFIKGANAIDGKGQAGVMLGMGNGGTIGKAIGHVMAKGINFIVPVGLEKAVLSPVVESAMEMGIEKVGHSTGMPVGLIPVSGKVITEIQALKNLSDVEVFHAASGGISGGEGSVTLLVKGVKAEIEKVIRVYSGLKEDNRLERLGVRPAACAKHKWPACMEKNICFRDNVRHNL